MNLTNITLVCGKLSNILLPAFVLPSSVTCPKHLHIYISISATRSRVLEVNGGKLPSGEGIKITDLIILEIIFNAMVPSIKLLHYGLS
jgi:hypothetical protein